MSILWLGNFKDTHIHKESMMSFSQDDGFGLCVDTRKFCFPDDDYYDNVYDFVYDSFDFVGEQRDF